MAAAALFANKGYAGTSVREIVEAAWVTKPTLYYYFKNKEDLFVKLMDMAMETFSLILDEALARKGAMRERLVGLYMDFHRTAHENVDLLKLVNSLIYGPHGATPAYDIMKVSGHMEAVFNAILDAGIREGELEDEVREDVMLLLIGLLRSIQVLLVLKMPHRTVTPESIAKAIDLVFDGARSSLVKSGELKRGIRQ
jgi:AcrR family transcriptional regulator